MIGVSGGKVRAVPGMCCGFANCSIRCPEVFTLDPKENRVRLLQEEVPGNLIAVVQQAVDECPTRALELIVEP
jgi:ferredoxin